MSRETFHKYFSISIIIIHIIFVAVEIIIRIISIIWSLMVLALEITLVIIINHILHTLKTISSWPSNESPVESGSKSCGLIWQKILLVEM
jgi:hypothetical protein